MNAQEAIQSIRTKKLENIYLVIGTENFLREQVRQAFFERLMLTETDLNFQQFDLVENSLNDVLLEVESSPFFGDYRLVFLENPLFLGSEKIKSEQEDALDKFIEYIEQPLETTILVVWFNQEKMDERKKITKRLKKAATRIDVEPMKEAEVRRYLQQTFNNEGLEFSRDAFEQFLFLTDASLSKAMREFEKIRLFAAEEKKINITIVDSLVPKSLEQNVFDLTESILAGKVEAALRLYEELRVQGEETIKINAILISQIRLLLQVRLLENIGYQQGSIAETLKVHPYRIKLAMQQARKFKVPQLVKLLDELIENDYATKTGKVEKEFAFQLLILKMGEIKKNQRS